MSQPGIKRILASLLLAFTGLPGLSACSTCDPMKRGDVATPPVDAQPEEVVRAYVSAVLQRDVETARQISTESFLERELSVSDSPFCNWKSADLLKVSEPEEIEFQEGGHENAVYVGVRLRITQLHEVSMKNGDAVWGYILVRDSEDGRWRVADSGVL